MSAEKPQTLTIWWCPECGQDDRWSPLKSGHYADAYRCMGEPRPLVYLLDGDA